MLPGGSGCCFRTKACVLVCLLHPVALCCCGLLYPVPMCCDLLLCYISCCLYPVAAPSCILLLCVVSCCGITPGSDDEEEEDDNTAQSSLDIQNPALRRASEGQNIRRRVNHSNSSDKRGRKSSVPAVEQVGNLVCMWV